MPTREDGTGTRLGCRYCGVGRGVGVAVPLSGCEGCWALAESDRTGSGTAAGKPVGATHKASSECAHGLCARASRLVASMPHAVIANIHPQVLVDVVVTRCPPAYHAQDQAGRAHGSSPK